MSQFRMATTIHMGPDALEAVSVLAGHSVFLVCDPFLESAPIMSVVRQHLGDARVTVYADIHPDPTTSQIANGLAAYLAAEPDAVLVMGGGSAVDTAKAIVKVAVSSDRGPTAGFIAIPSTSGAGSEVTSFAVVTAPNPDRKVVMVSDDMAPTIAILDPRVTRSLPPSLTADTGMDAVTHALEAYASTGATDFSDAFAEKAAQLAFQYLERAFHDGDDLEARTHMHNAATMAALAFENAGLGIVHSLAHALGGRFHQPHGRLNTILLSAVMEYNAGPITYGTGGISPVAERYAHIAHLLGLQAATRRNLALSLCAEVRRLQSSLGIPSRLTGLGIDAAELADAIPALAATAMQDACTPTNPRQPTVEDLEAILRSVS